MVFGELKIEAILLLKILRRLLQNFQSKFSVLEMLRALCYARNARPIIQVRFLSNSSAHKPLSPTEIWRNHERYDPNAVLKSGILQMTPAEAESVDTTSPEMRIFVRALVLFLICSVSYAFAMLGISLLRGDEVSKDTPKKRASAKK